MTQRPNISLQQNYNNNNNQSPLWTIFPSQDMTITFIIIVQLLISISISGNSTDRTQITIKKCQFFIIPPIQNLTFLFCTKPDGIQQTIWNNCIDACCGAQKGETFPIPNNQTLTKCMTIFLENKDNTNLIISVSIAATIFFVGLIIIANKILMKVPHRVIQVDQIDQDYLQQTLSQEISKIIWIKDGKMHENLLETDCSICLQNRCHLQISCKHFYHPECIGSWLTKSINCPNCNRINISKIKQYCMNCHMQYFVMRKDVFLDQLQDLKKLKCQTCIKILKTVEQEHLVQPWFYSFNKMDASSTFLQAQT